MKGIKALGIAGCMLTGTLSAEAASNFIVKLKKQGVSKFKSNLRNSNLFIGEEISENHGFYTVNYPLSLNSRSVDNALEELRANPNVEYAQLDHVVTYRGTQDFSVESNDPDFDKLWSFENISDSNAGTVNASKAWEAYGVGGVDAAGNDIVVAVIDGGFDMSHPDLVENWFVNEGEIADNGIDDDGNGYIDDVSGWSVERNSGANIPSATHGTHVAGIVGARGNNGVGVTGINWEVKVLPVSMSMRGLSTSKVIKAYTYVIDEKTRWIESNGAEGANIVASNSSFGIDGANCNNGDYPVWNDLYEAMGEVGVLSAAATANRNWNIDEVGDVPTGCSSDFIIAVTNTTKAGVRNPRAGYGSETIDLAASGTNIYSTVANGGYRNLTGTSMATPHIAGAVAYLYSVGGSNFAFATEYARGEAALLVKDILMETVRKSDAFDQTVSGGTLDLYDAASEMASIQ